MVQNHRLKYDMYEKDINRYKDNFESTILEIYEIIGSSADIQKMEARIKSYQSFIINLHKYLYNYLPVIIYTNHYKFIPSISLKFLINTVNILAFSISFKTVSSTS